MSNSIWHLRQSPMTEQAGTVIIGAGIAGISAALALETRGESVLLLDQRHPGWGATGRNAGFLMRGAADNYAAAARELGRENAALLWRLTEANLKRLRALGIESLPHCHPQPSCLVAFDETEADELAASLTLMQEDGFEVRPLLPADGLTDALWTSDPPRLGLVNPNDAVCDPMELLGLLRSKLSAPIHTETAVLGFDRSGPEVLVRTSRGTVRAGRVLICTNAYSGSLLPDLARHIQPNRGQMLALDATDLPESQRLQYAYYANHGSEYFRQVDDATIIVGGWRKHQAAAERTLDNLPTEPVQTGLERFARRVLGRALPVTHRWAGTMGFTPDGLPLGGPIDPEGDSRVWICAGFTGHGMSMAHEVASRTAAAMLGGDPLPDLFSPHRFSETA